jgi:predicted nuclease with TOPRIM domain
MGWSEKSSKKKYKPQKKHMLKLLASSSMTSPNMGQMNCKLLRKKGWTQKILQEEEEEKIKLKASIEKLMRIREENAKLKQHIANTENEQKNLTKKATVHKKLYRLLDEILSVDEPAIIKRTKNVLSDSSSSETAQPKTKKETP